MKRCPVCRRDYYDDTMLYCLDDGAALLEGPRHEGEQATWQLSSIQDRLKDTGILTNGEVDTSNAVAVLPFANLSRSKDSEYFSDGLAEELLIVLSRIKGLRVVARTSAFSFKGKQVGIGEIGRSLRVGSVL